MSRWLAVLGLLGIGMWAPSLGAETWDARLRGAGVGHPEVSSEPAAVESRSQRDAPVSVAPVPDQADQLIRQPPTLSGSVEIGGRAFIPYVGAGFGGGYATERDRILSGGDVGLQQNRLLGESSGRAFMPNEFHMGVRIPF